MLDALWYVIRVLLLLLVAAAVLAPIALLLSYVRTPLVGFLGYVARFVATALTAGGRIARALQQHLGLAAESALAGLAYRGRHADEAEEPSVYRGWDVIGPLVYTAAVVLMALGDFYMMILRFRTLLNLPGSSPSFGLPLDQLMGILWLVTVAVYGSILFDLHGISPIARPFHGASRRFRAWLRVIAWVGVTASLVAGGLLWFWGDRAIAGQKSILGTVFTVMFAVLLLGALVLASWAIIPAAIALYFLVLSALRIIAWGAALVLSLLVRLVEALAYVLVAIIDIPAG
nr:hypothetical protein [Ktedonobacterales bacterium]